MPTPHSRLFLVAPSGGDTRVLAACLKASLQAGDVASLLIGADKSLVQELMPIAREKDVAVLIAGDAEMAAALDADGVQVGADRQAYEAARNILGADRIVGADCGASRHTAMDLAEAGADYIMLDQTGLMKQGDTVISWWAKVMEVPCVASHPADAPTIADLARTGADFIRPSDDMWSSPQRAADTIAEANQAIADASR